MRVLKQKTVSGGGKSYTTKLVRLKNDLSRGGEYKYEIRDGRGEIMQGGFTKKENALSDFRQMVGDSEQAIRGAKSRQKEKGTEPLVQKDSMFDDLDDLF